MNKRILSAAIATLFLFACNTQPKENTDAQKKDTAEKIADAISNNISFLNDYNALEQLFTNDNWLMAGKKDSSYFYFSRLGNYKVNTYEYSIAKGDSANVKHESIQPEGNKLTWQFNGQKLYLTGATRAKSTWAVVGADSSGYEFTRLTNNEISLTYPDKRTVVMKKMLPFSLFLIRSFHDFKNGTKYAFDTTQFTRRVK